MKECIKCKELKELCEYHEDKRNKDRYKNQCKSCIKELKKKYFEVNKEYIKERSKKYYEVNKEKIKKRHREYYEVNKEKINKQQMFYNKNKRKEDSTYRLKDTLRSRTYNAFKYKGWKKNSKTQEMLGASYDVVKTHIERQFTKGMTWDNHGEWHIDHIYPLSKAKDEEHLRKLCHYTNLQPLWASDNISKSDKLVEHQIKLRV